MNPTDDELRTAATEAIVASERTRIAAELRGDWRTRLTWWIAGTRPIRAIARRLVR